jgi:sugar phosphate isomerase/epimerase
LAEEVRTLHVHDNDGRYDLHLIPHYGVIDWEDFGKALKEVQYQGVFSLETAPNKRIPLEAAELIYEAMVGIAKKIIGE